MFGGGAQCSTESTYGAGLRAVEGSRQQFGSAGVPRCSEWFLKLGLGRGSDGCCSYIDCTNSVKGAASKTSESVNFNGWHCASPVCGVCEQGF